MSTTELLCIALGVSLSVHFGNGIYPEPVHMAGHFWFVMFETAAVAFVSLGGRNKTQRIRMHNKLRALEALARHLGILRDGRKTVDRDLGPDAIEAMKARYEEQRALGDRARAKLMRVVEDYAREKAAEAKA